LCSLIRRRFIPCVWRSFYFSFSTQGQLSSFSYSDFTEVGNNYPTIMRDTLASRGNSIFFPIGLVPFPQFGINEADERMVFGLGQRRRYAAARIFWTMGNRRGHRPERRRAILKDEVDALTERGAVCITASTGEEISAEAESSSKTVPSPRIIRCSKTPSGTQRHVLSVHFPRFSTSRRLCSP
jgi:hypothetical protein